MKERNAALAGPSSRAAHGVSVPRVVRPAAILALSCALVAQSPPFAGNNNRPERLGVGKVLMLSLGYSDASPQHIITPTEHLAHARELERIVAKNSYGKYTLEVTPRPGEAPDAYRIMMPHPTSYYRMKADNDPDDFRIWFLFEMIDEAEGLQLNPHAYDHIVYYTGDDNGGQEPWVTPCNLPFESLGTAAGVKHVLVTGRHHGGVAVAHELEHVFAAAHATCWRSAEREKGTFFFEIVPAPVTPILSYGDPFDLMGLGGGCGPRVCRGLVPGQTQFAPNDDIHVSPVRKWQQHWLTDEDVLVVSNSGGDMPAEAVIKNLASQTPAMPGEYRMVEIPRGFSAPDPAPSEVPESMFLYYRGNEPLSRNGVTISFGTKEKTAFETRMVRFNRGQTGAVKMCPDVEPPCTLAQQNPCEDLSKKIPCSLGPALRLMEMFHDPHTGATVCVTEVDPMHEWAKVQIMFDGTPEITNDHAAIVDVVGVNLPASKIIGPEGITGGVTSDLVVRVSAYDPDYNPSDPQMWDNIKAINYRLRIPPLNVGDTHVYRGAISEAELPQGQPIKLSFDLSAAALEKIAPGKFTDATRTGGMSIIVETGHGTFMRGGISFYIDHDE